MTEKFMARMNAIALRVRDKGTLSYFELMKAENISPSYIEQLRPYIVGLFDDIECKNRVFYVKDK